jgi:hypothetical protein
MKVTVPLPLTVPVCPEASVTAMWDEFVLPDRLTVVLPPALATARLMEAVPLLASVMELGLADKVQAFGVGLGVGAGVGVGTGVGVGVGVGVLQFTPLLLQGVGVGTGVG